MKKRLALTALVLPVGALVAIPFAAQAALGASHTTTRGAAILHSAKPALDLGVGTPAVKPPHPPHPPFPPTPPYYGPPFPWPLAH